MIFNFNELVIDSMASLSRVMLGGGMAIIVGIVFGLLRFQLPVFLKKNFLFNFCLDVFKYPPPLAYIPFVILFLGIGLKAALAIVFIGVFPAISTNTYEALKNIKTSLIETAQSLEIQNSDLLFKIYLPAIFPQVFTGIRVGFSMGWMSIIAAEMISGDKGLGYSLQVHRQNLNLESMVIYMIAIGFFGFGLNYIFKIVEERVVRWKD